MIGLFPNALYTPHCGQGKTGRGPTNALWARVYESAINPDGTPNLLYWFDDFIGYNALTTTGAFGRGPYYGFIEDSSAIASVATEYGGVLRMTTGTSDDTDISFGMGQVAGCVKVGVGVPGTLTGLGGKVAFEARFRVADVSDHVSFVLGLAEEGCVANNGFMTDAHAAGAKDFLGFYVSGTNGDLLNFGYSVGSGSPVSVGTKAIAADTWYKVGFIYDPEETPSKRIKWYVDGVEQSTYVTAATVAASTFPGGEEMGPFFEEKNNEGAANTMDLDWFGFAMQGVT